MGGQVSLIVLYVGILLTCSVQLYFCLKNLHIILSEATTEKKKYVHKMQFVNHVLLSKSGPYT